VTRKKERKKPETRLKMLVIVLNTTLMWCGVEQAKTGPERGTVQSALPGCLCHWDHIFRGLTQLVQPVGGHSGRKEFPAVGATKIHSMDRTSKWAR
jgi:hypothetical protein